MAHVVGVGRGADLLMYLWVVVTFSAVLTLYLKIVEMNQMLTELARRLALGEPTCPGPLKALTGYVHWFLGCTTTLQGPICPSRIV